LACPCTILGHPLEGYAWGRASLVRISVGLADSDMLLSLFKEALAKTENAVQLKVTRGKYLDSNVMLYK
jgi:hypothetical protein